MKLKRSLRSLISSPSTCSRETGVSRRTVYDFLEGRDVLMSTFVCLFNYANANHPDLSMDEMVELWGERNARRISAN